MYFHNDPDAPDTAAEDDELRELTLAQFDAIKASILAGQPNNLQLIYDRLDDWLVGCTRAETNKLIVDTLAGKAPFAVVINDLVWDEALSRAKPEQVALSAQRQQDAEDDRIQAYIDARAA